MTKLLALRDFVYLDVERLKSISAQGEEGSTLIVMMGEKEHGGTSNGRIIAYKKSWSV